MELRIAKGGYQAVAVEMRRLGGDFEQIGVSLRANHVDETPPESPNVPELREYRALGLVGNSRVGSPSDVATAVTRP